MATFSRAATLEWSGGFPRGSGTLVAESAGFSAPASFPMISGEPPGVTTPEELLAASHAVCFGIGLRGVIARRGGTAQRVTVRATITAEKSAGGIRIQSSHLDGEVVGLAGVDADQLEEIAVMTKEECTISNLMRGNAEITHHVVAV